MGDLRSATQQELQSCSSTPSSSSASSDGGGYPVEASQSRKETRRESISSIFPPSSTSTSVSLPLQPTITQTHLPFHPHLQEHRQHDISQYIWRSISRGTL